MSTSGLIGNLPQANYAVAKLGIAAMSKCLAMDMQRFFVRSNCISPFAWSRMIGSIPTGTEEQKARVERLKTMESARIAPLASDWAKDVTGQIFAVRANEIVLMGQSRPLRSAHASDGGHHRRARHSGAALAFLPAGPLAGRVHVGPGVGQHGSGVRGQRC